MSVIRIEGFEFMIDPREKDPIAVINNDNDGPGFPELRIPIRILKEFIDSTFGNLSQQPVTGEKESVSKRKASKPPGYSSGNVDVLNVTNMTYQSEVLSELLDVMYEIQRKI